MVCLIWRELVVYRRRIRLRFLHVHRSDSVRVNCDSISKSRNRRMAASSTCVKCKNLWESLACVVGNRSKLLHSIHNMFSFSLVLWPILPLAILNLDWWKDKWAACLNLYQRHVYADFWSRLGHVILLFTDRRETKITLETDTVMKYKNIMFGILGNVRYFYTVFLSLQNWLDDWNLVIPFFKILFIQNWNKNRLTSISSTNTIFFVS